MALQSVPNKIGVRASPLRVEWDQNNATANNVINAVGESVAVIGRCFLEGATGSKTISSSGGKIYVTLNSITWANAGTTLRVGIQDVVATTGIEDTTYDVSADLVPGTETLTSSVVNTITMETGTKTITHGDIIAVVFEMTARGGADSVDIQAAAFADNLMFPYKTQDTGAGPAKTTSDVPGVMIEFDDGTFGWIAGLTVGLPATFTYAANSATDEYDMIFQIPFKASLTACDVGLSTIVSGDDFEVILYTDPLGTPAVVETITVDPDIIGSTAGFYRVNFTPYTLSINTNYAIAVRPTTNNTISLNYLDFNTNNGNLRKSTALGTSWSLGSRADQTGAFSSTTTRLPAITLFFDKFDDAVSSGGSGSNTGAVWIG